MRMGKGIFQKDIHEISVTPRFILHTTITLIKRKIILSQVVGFRFSFHEIANVRHPKSGVMAKIRDLVDPKIHI
jgi:hypothetical protein